MTSLIIFDLDGTLLDTRKDIADACNHALRCCGCPERMLDEYNTLVGRGITNLFKGALPEEIRTDAMVEKMRSFFVPYYNEHKCDSTRPYEGIEGLLEALEEKGIRIAVASNKYQHGTEELVKRYFGRFSFTAVLGQRERFPLKPDPSVIIEAMKAAGVSDTDDVVYCGDSDVDMQTGRNAGIRTIGVTWGFRSKEELAAYSPWLLADTPEEIRTVLTPDMK